MFDSFFFDWISGAIVPCVLSVVVRSSARIELEIGMYWFDDAVVFVVDRKVGDDGNVKLNDDGCRTWSVRRNS